MRGAFEAAVLKTLAIEGGYADDPYDPGGETKYGISKAQYPNVDVERLTREQAVEIYRRDYWQRLSLDRIKDGRLSAEIFDTAVNQGQETAATILQGALTLLGRPLTIDGNIGPVTVEAANSYPHTDSLLKLMNVLQGMVYLLGAGNVKEVMEMIEKRKSHVRRYIRGWLERVELGLVLVALLALAGCAMTSQRTCEKKGDVETCVDYFHWG